MVTISHRLVSSRPTRQSGFHSTILPIFKPKIVTLQVRWILSKLTLFTQDSKLIICSMKESKFINKFNKFNKI